MSSIPNKQLRIGAKALEFKTPIKDTLIVDGITLVLLQRVGVQIEDRGEVNRNVLAFDGDGNQIWTIEEAPDGGRRNKPYTAIYKSDQGLIAYCGLGYEYVLNPKTGGVTPSGNRPW